MNTPIKPWSEIPKRTRYVSIPLCVLLMALCLSFPYLHGCASANPNAGKPIVDPVTGVTNGVQPPFLPNTTGTKIVGYVNQATPFIPAPYGDLVTLAAGLATLVMTKIASSKKAQLTAVVQGVEDGTSAPTVTPAGVKTAIQARATAAGVQTALDKTVQKLT